MLVTNKNAPKNDQKLSITLNGHTLEHVRSMHYLHVDVDENLIWKEHANSLTRVLSYKLCILTKANKYMNSTLLNMIYIRSIQPCLHYACSAWGNCSEGSKLSLLKQQK